MEADIHFIGINETKLGPLIDDKEIALENYSVVRKDRNRHGGGVALYVTDRLTYKIPALNNVHDGTEYVLVEAYKGTLPSRVCCVYRPPDSSLSWLDKFKKLLDEICDGTSKDFYLMGILIMIVLMVKKVWIF